MNRDDDIVTSSRVEEVVLEGDYIHIHVIYFDTIYIRKFK